jgi:hypothetical protein
VARNELAQLPQFELFFDYFLLAMCRKSLRALARSFPRRM